MVFGDKDIKLPSKMATGVLTTLLGAAIAFNAWAVKEVYARPTRIEVKELITDKSDSPVIFEMLKGIREDIRELKDIIRKQSLNG